MSLQQQQQFQQLQQQLLPQLQQQVKQEDGGAWDDGVAAFIKSLLHMLQDPENVEVIYWTKRGSFIVRDCSEFETRILPKYFKTSKFCSFVRQLNTYGFRKVDSPPDPLQKRYEFHNRYFRADHPELLKYIQRRKSSKRDSAEIDLLDDLQRSPLSDLGNDTNGVNTLLLAELARLQKQNDDTQLVLKKMAEEVNVWKKSRIFKKRVAKFPTLHSDLLARVDRMEQRERDIKRQKTTNMQDTRPQPTLLQQTTLSHPTVQQQQMTVLQHMPQGGYIPAHLLPVKMEKMEEWGMGINTMTLGGDNGAGAIGAPPGIPFELLSSSLPQLEYLLFESDDEYTDDVGFEVLAAEVQC